MGAILVFLFEPLLFILIVPAIIWQIYSEKYKKDLLEDLSTALIVTLILAAIKYSL